MSSIRVIARLDIKGPNLVKGVHLEGLRVLGRPEEFARHYYETGADELMYMDVVASLYERNSLHEIISRTAREIFVPLTVGGGIRKLDDISRVLSAGADKVSINTAAIRNPEFIQEASRRFGSSTIVVAIEAIRQPDGQYLAYTDNGREHTGIDAFAWAEQAAKLGAGEIVATSVDRDGTGDGFDIDFVKQMTAAVAIPVIAHGGPGKLSHIAEVAPVADAIAVASMLHYGYANEKREINTESSEGNLQFLRSGAAFARIQNATVAEIKAQVSQSGIPCRPAVTCS
ncbi:imidazole glycerol phosphate synthase subunit HisF [Planctomycetaceae bacterium SH139]